MVNQENRSFNPDRYQLPQISGASSITDWTDLVIGLVDVRGTDTLVGVPAKLAKQLAGSDGELLTQLQALGANSSNVVTLLVGNQRVICVGMGEDCDANPEQFRQAAGNGTRAALKLSKLTERKLVISLEANSPAAIQAVAEGALLASYRFQILGKKLSDSIIESITVLSGAAKETKPAIERAKITAKAVWIARDWSDTPPNLLGPADLASQAEGYLADKKISVKVLDEKALRKQGHNGILAVGGGSVRPPRLLIAEYRPRKAKFNLVIVGKGITYDSGGYNLKPGSSLLTMKHDMAGAAAVITALKAIAELDLNINVTAIAPIAEQMISGQSYRPSDVITMFNGTTVENMNSDCEGRIVLADALALACQDYQPDLVVDIATLTGACLVALGTKLAGLLANNDASADKILDAATVAGEDYWQLPITDEVRDDLKSDFADLKSKGDRYGATLFGAAFLEKFITPQTNWAHLDIAGPAWNSGSAYHYVSKNSTGFGVRTLVALAEQLSE